MFYKRSIAAVIGAMVFVNTLPALAAPTIIQARPDAQCSLGPIPTSVKPGQSFPVTVKVQNIGLTTWNAYQNYLIFARGNASTLSALTTKVAPKASYSFSVTSVAPSTVGQFLFTAQMRDLSGKKFGALCSASITVALPEARVVGRSLFYNNSLFDGNTTYIDDVRDPLAIATDKQPLFNGQTATFANYTSYSKGINGVIIDIANLANTVNVTSDFSFRVGNDNAPSSWKSPSLPTMVILRGAGVSGSDRIFLIWPDNVIKKQWLQVTVKANANTGLKTDDVFYFGNAIAETGNSLTNAFVDGSDVAGARDNQISNAVITNKYDFNRDGKVNATDMTIATTNATNFITALKLITPSVLVQPVCGNAKVEAGEQCDDGNTTNGDGCSAKCMKEQTRVDISVVKSGSQATLTLGGMADYRIAVMNSGSTVSGEVTIADRIPAGLIYVRSTGPALCVKTSDNYVLCDIENILPGQTVSYFLHFTVENNANLCGSAISNVATLLAYPNDLNPANNSGSSKLPVMCAPVCGNAKVETGEQCDDGNTTNGDGCSAMCKAEVCGNATRETTIGQNATRSTATAISAYLDSIRSTALDVDGNGKADALTDGILINRYLLGTRGNDLIAQAVDLTGTRTTAVAITSFLDANRLAYDVDGNGAVIATEDGSIILRYLFSLTGNKLVGEECDDGNTTNGDGCSNQCVIESNYHSADYNKDWVISGTEMNRVQSYWRAGAYYVNAGGADGYAAGVGSHVGKPHSSDINGDWVIDTAEKDWTETLWLSGGYRWDVALQKFMPRSPVCGNKFVEQTAGEQCDDGNTTNGDGCSATCQLEPAARAATILGCSNGHCDLKNVAATMHEVIGSLFQTSPKYDVSGDGKVTQSDLSIYIGVVDASDIKWQYKAYTVLDRGDFALTQADADAVFPLIVQALYTVNPSYDVTEQNSTINQLDIALYISVADMFGVRLNTPVCGNAKVETGEQCDDGNTANGDGCSAMCKIETEKIGNLFVTQNPTSAHQLLAGSLGDSVLSLTFSASNADVEVSKLRFLISGADLSAAQKNVATLQLYRLGEVNAFMSTGSCGPEVAPAGTSLVCANFAPGRFVIAKDRSITVNIRPQMNSADAGAVAGEYLTFGLLGSEEGVPVEARDMTAAKDLVKNNGNAIAEGEIFIGRSTTGPDSLRIVGQKNLVVFSKLSSITNGGPSTGVMPLGRSTIGSFTFTTAPAHPLNISNTVLSDLIFNVNASNVYLNAKVFVLSLRRGDISNRVNCAPFDVSGSSGGTVTGNFFVRCSSIPSSMGTIAPNESRTFDLDASVVNTNTGADRGLTSTLQVSLMNFSNMSASTFGVQPNDSHIQWLDQWNSALGQGSVQNKWIEIIDTQVDSTQLRG